MDPNNPFSWAGVPNLPNQQDPNSTFANTLSQLGNPGLGGPGQQIPGLPASLNAPGPQPGQAQMQQQQPPGVASLLSAFSKGGGGGDAAQGAASAAGGSAMSWMDKAMPWLMALQVLGGNNQAPVTTGSGRGVNIPTSGAIF